MRCDEREIANRDTRYVFAVGTVCRYFCTSHEAGWIQYRRLHSAVGRFNMCTGIFAQGLTAAHGICRSAWVVIVAVDKSMALSEAAALESPIVIENALNSCRSICLAAQLHCRAELLKYVLYVRACVSCVRRRDCCIHRCARSHSCLVCLPIADDMLFEL